MVGRKRNQAEKGISFLLKVLGYKEGKKLITGARYKGRSITRPKLDTGDYYSNCIFTFIDPVGGRKYNYELDCALPFYKIDYEIDGSIYHDKERDNFRDDIIKCNGWSVIRIPSDCVYETLIPLAYELKKEL